MPDQTVEWERTAHSVWAENIIVPRRKILAPVQGGAGWGGV